MLKMRRVIEIKFRAAGGPARLMSGSQSVLANRRHFI
jgi:hypothetical protein